MNSKVTTIETWRDKNNVDSSKSDKTILDWRAQRLAIAALIPTVYEAGYVISTPLNGDDDAGVDLTISRSITLGDIGGAALEIQVKSIRVGSDTRGGIPDRFTYDLEAAAYNRLVVPHDVDYVFAPVVFDRNVDWIRESDEVITQQCQRYLIHLLGRDKTHNDKTQSVPIGPEDKLDSGRLRRFIERNRG